MTMMKGQKADHVGLGLRNSHGHEWALARLSRFPLKLRKREWLRMKLKRGKPCLPMSFLPFVPSLSFPIWKLRIVILAFYQHDKNEKALFKVYLKFCKYNAILIQQVCSPAKRWCFIKFYLTHYDLCGLIIHMGCVGHLSHCLCCSWEEEVCLLQNSEFID